jgi:hypothetical protein
MLQKHRAANAMKDDAGTQRAIRNAILAEDPDFSAVPARVAIYRRLVRNTLADVTHKILPRTRERMGAPFDDAFAKFLEARGPVSHYLRDVPRELLAFAIPAWRAANLPTWLLDLARHELAWFQAATFDESAAEKNVAEDVTEVALDRTLVFSTAASLERFTFAVHEDFPANETPAKRDVALLYFRNEHHDVVAIELDALGAELFACSELPLKDAIARACEKANVPMNDDALANVARLLADLGAHGVLLGARAHAPKTRT